MLFIGIRNVKLWVEKTCGISTRQSTVEAVYNNFIYNEILDIMVNKVRQSFLWI